MTNVVVSVCVPVYNESINVERLYRRVFNVFKGIDGVDFELIFTDNNSEDDTYEIIKGLARRDSRVRGAKFLRNHGYQNSIFAGYLLASGECLIQLDCDMQDPPEIIPQMIDYWHSGYQVVYGVRRSRGESWLINSMRKIFYRSLNWLSDHPIPLDAGDFRLIDRNVIDALRVIDDRKPYLRGTISRLGFKEIGLPYDRDIRKYGETKFKIRQLIELATDGVVSNSAFPLTMANYVGIVAAVTAFIWLLITFIGKFIFHAPWPAGFATLVVLLLINISLVGFFFGIFGSYFARALRQLKPEPLVIIEESIGLKDRSPDTKGRIHFIKKNLSDRKLENSQT
ncbi:glycosyltransferase family 2 protein [Alphaproteobacteria bacterium]|nr:glycosyltransferase family 2 protein [Alphaproteobacteria bacterium]